MNPDFFGDSYDHVKRTLLSIRLNNRPYLAVPFVVDGGDHQFLSAYAKFLQCELHSTFTSLSSQTDRKSWFNDLGLHVASNNANVFLDPDTGIRIQQRSRKYMCHRVSIEELASVVQLLHADSTLVCFDQSLSRGSEDEDRSQKLGELKSRQIAAVYFWSHASFVICSRSTKVIDDWKTEAVALGIPGTRIQAD